MTSTLPAPLFGIYVHWPFCRSKCPYCDFNSHVRDAVDQRRWRNALQAELWHYATQTPGRAVTSIFFGGGTPSLMPPETVAAVIESIRNLWPVSPDVEITLEANPTSVEAARFEALRAAGVNRVSLGVQAFDAQALRFLGREHDVGDALAALALARDIFPRHSFDLIYARPGQTVDAWRAELDQALGFVGDHLSVYQLTIERGTRFWQDHARGLFTLPDEDTQAALFEATQARLADSYLPAYEISNHARTGGACRHNLAYWRYEDYVGIGPGAHGRVPSPGDGDASARKRATRQATGPEAWLEQVEAHGHATAEDTIVQGADLVAEALMMGLRLTDGIDRTVFRRVTGVDPVAACDADALHRLVDGGFLAISAQTLRATARGRQVLNAVLARLLDAVRTSSRG
ncbi:radical SAM family heme chaperone HemW [Vineibacter terrae]|uniref:radical SAM family heme chaperone HemW n=1 Tax=Vineibacter terrae TaxID=2586908 RepID=UPI002E3430E2|nr:radical SAM family heme chaperone HemW [Vineibacter terrae]HEX2889253.1 radical SAM family heme chaperone HemW [Vineibacter terrae]